MGMGYSPGLFHSRHKPPGTEVPLLARLYPFFSQRDHLI
jgi:hypothetical protein